MREYLDLETELPDSRDDSDGDSTDDDIAGVGEALGMPSGGDEDNQSPSTKCC